MLVLKRGAWTVHVPPPVRPTSVDVLPPALCPSAGQIFGLGWSPDGKLLATVCKDGKVRVYDPRKSTAPVEVRRATHAHTRTHTRTHDDHTNDY